MRARPSISSVAPSFPRVTALLALALLAAAGPARADEAPSPWYTEAGAFAEFDRDRDPLGVESDTRSAGLGAEVRLGRSLSPHVDLDAGLRIGGDVARTGYVLGADTGLRLHPDTFVAPYIGLRAGYTRVVGSFADPAAAEGAQALGRTTQDGLHLRPEVGLAIGRTDTLRVLLGVTANVRLLNTYRAVDGDGLPTGQGAAEMEAPGLAGAMARLAVSVAL